MSPADSHFEAGHARWPALALDAARFEHHIAARPDNPPLVQYAPDLFLACACAHGVHGAVEAFERTYAGAIARTVGRVNRDAAFVADAVQAVRVHVLLPRGDALPRIAEYAGRAPLGAWLAATALRVAMNLRRGKSEEPHDELSSTVGALADAVAPELALLRARHKSDLETAIRAALRLLSPRDRTLLRLHLAERMSIDGLAVVYSVGRSTAARWLAGARASLLERTRERFCETVGLSFSEFDSVAAALRSDLDLSLITHLAASQDPAP